MLKFMFYSEMSRMARGDSMSPLRRHRRTVGSGGNSNANGAKAQRVTAARVADNNNNSGNVIGVNGVTGAALPTTATSKMTARMDGTVYIGNDGDDRDSVTSVEVPRGATLIADKAFYWYIHLTSVTLPNTVTSIGHWAFSSCRDSLAAIDLPPNTT